MFATNLNIYVHFWFHRSLLFTIIFLIFINLSLTGLLLTVCLCSRRLILLTELCFANYSAPIPPLSSSLSVSRLTSLTVTLLFLLRCLAPSVNLSLPSLSLSTSLPPTSPLILLLQLFRIYCWCFYFCDCSYYYCLSLFGSIYLLNHSLLQLPVLSLFLLSLSPLLFFSKSLSIFLSCAPLVLPHWLSLWSYFFSFCSHYSSPTVAAIATLFLLVVLVLLWHALASQHSSYALTHSKF